MSGIVFNGLYLVQKEPSKGDKGLLVNGKYFIPVTNESSGAVASYYKCTAVSSGASQPEGYNLTMSFLDVIDFDYATEPTVIQLTMTDSTKTGLDREWVSANGGYTLKKYVSPYDGYISWGLYANNGDIYTHYVSLGLLDQNKITVNDEGNSVDQRDPWEITQLYSETGFMDTGTITWTVSPAVSGESTWSGYKAVFDSTAGTWSFESGVTEGLTYTSVTPVVGGIYTKDALVTVSMLYDKLFDGIISYYKLDGNARDSASIYDGTANNVTYKEGKSGLCASVSNYSKYIDLPKGVSLHGLAQASYSIWVFLESAPSQDFYPVTEIANSSGYTRCAISITPALLPLTGVRTAVTSDTGAFQKVTGINTLQLNTWYFICGVFDLLNGAVKLYLNGTLEGSLSITASTFASSVPERIRICEFDVNGSGNVRADELGIWSKALTDTEVSELYNNGVGKFL